MVSIGDRGILNKEISQLPSGVWIDRDREWLDLNDRVLAEALHDRTRLLERVKFLAIFASSLDQCFMKRSSILHSRAMPEAVLLLASFHSRLEESLQRPRTVTAIESSPNWPRTESIYGRKAREVKRFERNGKGWAGSKTRGVRAAETWVAGFSREPRRDRRDLPRQG